MQFNDPREAFHEVFPLFTTPLRGILMPTLELYGATIILDYAVEILNDDNLEIWKFSRWSSWLILNTEFHRERNFIVMFRTPWKALEM